ncbi:MAG: carboxyl transferase [Lachnospiraceae bacterium]|nr:carboxyl transferase [Lachnospiraceae bacterium]
MGKTLTLSAGDRIKALLDDNSFVEIGGMVTARSTDFNLSQKKTPEDGVITGYGVVNGALVYVYSQDASVLNGSMGEMHAEKIGKLYDMAMKVGAPVVGLVDCSGFRLQESTDALAAFGKLYQKQALASGLIPQITAIFGNCGGGLSLIPGMTDFTFMAEDAKLFVNSPNAIPGNSEDKLNQTTLEYQSTVAGNVDVGGSEAEVLAKIRTLLSFLPSNYEEDATSDITDDMNRMVPEVAAYDGDAAAMLSVLADNRLFFETKQNFAKNMVTGFLKLNGQTVGAVANRAHVLDENGEVAETFPLALTTDGCEKAASFVRFCDAFGLPVLTLTNADGFAASIEEEKTLAKAAAKLSYAFASATVPKVNLVYGIAFGSAYNVMNSKPLGADIVFAWENANIGIMDPELAVKIIYKDEIDQAENKSALLAEKTAEYKELQSGVLSAARRGYVDTVILPESTRKQLIEAFEMLYSKKEVRPEKKHGAV